jgi:hypothetical protein
MVFGYDSGREVLALSCNLSWALGSGLFCAASVSDSSEKEARLTDQLTLSLFYSKREIVANIFLRESRRTIAVTADTNLLNRPC